MVSLPDGQSVLDDVAMFKSPRGMPAEVALVCRDRLWDDIDPRVVDVITGQEEATHPRHIAARNIQQTHALDAQTTLDSTNEVVKSHHRFDGKVDLGSGTCQRQKTNQIRGKVCNRLLIAQSRCSIKQFGAAEVTAAV